MIDIWTRALQSSRAEPTDRQQNCASNRAGPCPI